MTNKNNLIFWSITLVLLMVFLYLYGDRMGPGAGRQDRVAFSHLPTGGDFEMISADGPVRLSDYKGKVVLIYFGYTFCPDVCPTSLQTMAAAIKKYPKEKQKEIVGLFVSVDPKRDTPEKLKEYVSFFHPDFVGTTGSKEQIFEIQKKYDVNYKIQKNEENPDQYGVDHTSYVFLVDRQGELTARLEHGISVDKLVQKIGKTL